MKNILIISPHPDDMEIGMGGTVAKLVAEGFDVISVVATDGRRSTNVSGCSEDEMVAIRKAEAEAAANILKVKNLLFFELEDMKSVENKRDMKEKLGVVIEHFKPAEVYMTHPVIDKHPTHQALSALAVEVLDKLRNEKSFSPEIWCYEVWTSFEKYDRLVDISNYAHKKVAAIGAHKSQLAYKDYTGGILGLNKYRAVFNVTGGITNMKYAEVFIQLYPKV